MNFYIRIENGLPVDHPAGEDNLLAAFPDGIPSNWELFVRIEPPELTEDQMFDEPKVTYKKVNGVWTDVFHVIPASAEVLQAIKQKKIDAFKAFWSTLPQRENFATWTFNEDTIAYEPPIPRPTDREVYWQGKTNSWVDRPPKPNDGKNYRIDFDTGEWVVIPTT